MENKNVNNLKPEGYETPSSYVFGWLCLAFSFIPLILGIVQKQKVLIIVGISIIVIGILLLFLGKIQSEKLLNKLNKKDKR